MKPTTKDVLLKIYYVFQWLHTILLIVGYIICRNIPIMLYGVLHDYPPTVIEEIVICFILLSIIVVLLLLLIIAIISTISTKNILHNKSLTKLQKFSAVTFPIITIPFYLYLIFKLFIQYR